MCEAFGLGSVQHPGSEVCVRLSGDVKSHARHRGSTDIIIAEPGRNITGPSLSYDLGRLSDDVSLLRTRAEVRTFLTTAVATEAGPLIAAAGLKVRRDAPRRLRPGEPVADQALLELAYVSWAGVTAGYAPSFFDFTPSLTYTTAYASEINTNLFAYTHAVGEDTFLTVSLEDGSQREIVDASWGEYARGRYPDVVGRMRRNFDWGAAQLAGALHPIRGAAIGDCCEPVFGEAMGWAAMAGVEAYFDVAGMSAELLLNAAASKGGLSYLNATNYPADFAISRAGESFLTDGQALVAAYALWWTSAVRTVASLSHFWTELETDTMHWRANGMLVQGAFELHPARGFVAGVEMNYFRDTAQGGDTGLIGPKLVADHISAVAFARFRF